MSGNNSHPSDGFLPSRIVSGGQTGVDRGALDAAIAIGIAHGGWCPAGRLSEDGTIPSRYDLHESDSPEYPVRTEQNVVDSDATLILYIDQIKGGTKLTRRYCIRHDKPHLVVPIADKEVATVQRWLGKERPHCLNVAGPRESNHPGISELAQIFLLRVFQ